MKKEELEQDRTRGERTMQTEEAREDRLLDIVGSRPKGGPWKKEERRRRRSVSKGRNG
jgi:hypothetical protein